MIWIKQKNTKFYKPRNPDKLKQASVISSLAGVKDQAKQHTILIFNEVLLKSLHYKSSEFSK